MEKNYFSYFGDPLAGMFNLVFVKILEKSKIVSPFGEVRPVSCMVRISQYHVLK